MHARISLYIIHYFRMHEKCICEVYSQENDRVLLTTHSIMQNQTLCLGQGLYHHKERFNAYDGMSLTQEFSCPEALEELCIINVLFRQKHNYRQHLSSGNVHKVHQSQHLETSWKMTYFLSHPAVA
jgi:hypothetical protein